jgi:hypothetical protein
VGHSCNPRYSGGRSWFRASSGKKFMRPFSTNKLGVMAKNYTAITSCVITSCKKKITQLLQAV